MAFGTAPGSIRRIALLGNHLPRQCGIATFTTDLSDALAAAAPGLDCFVLAMNDVGHRHDYPARVRFEIAEGDPTSYRRAADFLDVNTVDLVCVQHEYGIFGGKAGSHVLPLLRDVRMPIVTTLHTILGAPDPSQRRAMDELVRLSDRVVVMSNHGATLLREVHGVSPDKIDVIPHGIPDIRRDPASKERLGVEGRPVILTFGLLSPDKGIEHVVDALPAIVARHPDAVYVVLGATHPHVREHHGETYRLSLETRARRLGVDGSIVFHDRFVSQTELAEFLSAADVYITPYLKEEQITSGTLAYAVGTGIAVVSTPYVYARELLADGRGVLVPVADPAAIAREIVDLLGDGARREMLCERAFAEGRKMVWPAVAQSYLASFARARAERAARRRTAFRPLARHSAGLPAAGLGHLGLLTDDTGLFQHAVFTLPRRSDGYCVDDNARGLLLMALLEEARTDDRATIHALATKYLSFVEHAYDRGRGRFRNFMSFSRRWLEECGSEDSHGRALWALGTVVGRGSHAGRLALARELFHAALPAVLRFSSPRAWAYASLGIDEYLRAYEGDSNVQGVLTQLAGQLLALHRRASRADWPWFEGSLTYANGRLPQALLVGGVRLGDESMTSTALRSLEWLWSVQDEGGVFSPIGTAGFWVRGSARAAFDQQPIEAASMVSALLAAHRGTSDAGWLDRARRTFGWFLGHNRLQRPLYDASTGGCRDGLHEDRANENQGAESTVSFLIALSEMRSSDRDVPFLPRPARDRDPNVEA